jgi:hypothetical protein
MFWSFPAAMLTGSDRTDQTPPEPDTEQMLGFIASWRRAPAVCQSPWAEDRRPQAGLVCGFLGCDQSPFNPLISALPRSLLFVGSGGKMAARRSPRSPDRRPPSPEAQDKDPSGADVRLRLSELIFVETIRRYLATLPKADRLARGA